MPAYSPDATVNFCYCKNCLPPSPVRSSRKHYLDVSAQPDNFGAVYDSINPLQPQDPSDNTLFARVMWYVVGAVIFSMQYVITPLAAVYVAAYLAMPQLRSSWLFFAAVQELLWAGAGHLFSKDLNRYFDQCQMPRFSQQERWRYFTETVHAIHPSAVPVPWRATAVASSTPQLDSSAQRDIDAFRHYLKTSRPLPSIAGQPYHIVQHIGTFLSGWFLGKNPCQIKHGNLEEWFAWAFFNRDARKMRKDFGVHPQTVRKMSEARAASPSSDSDVEMPDDDDNEPVPDPAYDSAVSGDESDAPATTAAQTSVPDSALVEEVDELNAMIEYLEKQTGIRLEDGYDESVRCLRLNLDEKRTTWRAGVMYLATTLMSLLVFTILKLCRYQNYYSSDSTLILHVPRSVVLNAKDGKRKTAADKRPILFAHGLGVGVLPYLPVMLYTYLVTGRPIIFLHVPSVSMRLFGALPPTRDRLISFVRTVLTDELHMDKQWPDGVTMMSHSLGSTFAAWLIKAQVETREQWEEAQQRAASEAAPGRRRRGHQRNKSKVSDADTAVRIGTEYLPASTLRRHLSTSSDSGRDDTSDQDTARRRRRRHRHHRRAPSHESSSLGLLSLSLQTLPPPPMLLRDLIFTDPICFGLCWSDVAYNFVYKRPRTWSQALTRFFAGRDPGISGYLYRHFWWFENVLFRSQWEKIGQTASTPAVPADLRTIDRPVTPMPSPWLSSPAPAPTSLPSFTDPSPITTTTSAVPVMRVFLSEHDSIVNSESVCRYLEREGVQRVDSSTAHPTITTALSGTVGLGLLSSSSKSPAPLTPYATVRVVKGTGHGGLLAHPTWWRELVTVLNVE
ncbi:hypothetical protein RI367_007339 [Sorochytrium milnesiophthora]